MLDFMSTAKSEDYNFLSARQKKRRLVFYREPYVKQSLSAVLFKSAYLFTMNAHTDRPWSTLFKVYIKRNIIFCRHFSGVKITGWKMLPQIIPLLHIARPQSNERTLNKIWHPPSRDIRDPVRYELPLQPPPPR